MRLSNSFFSIVVDDKAKHKFTTSNYLGSWVIVLECKWKHPVAAPFLTLFVWDRHGESLAFQYQNHIHTLKSRPEFERHHGEAVERLRNVRLEFPAQLGCWFGQYRETIGPQHQATQLELVCDTDNHLVAYCHSSFMECADDAMQRVRNMLAPLQVSSCDAWDVSSKLTASDNQ